MSSVVSKFFQEQAAKIAGQVLVLRAQFGKATADDDRIEQIIASLDFSAWAVLAGDLEPILDDIGGDQSIAVLARLGIDVEVRSEVLNVVSADALAYARTRSAEMVGMRRNELGRLVPNPRAQWRITEGTREALRGVITQALTDGWSNQRLAEEMVEAYAFSKERATVIARTETQMATQAASLQSYKASGVVDGKQWLTAEDDRVSEECQANGEAGPNGDGVLRDWDANYPSGDAAPPAHPNCRCAVLPWFDPNVLSTPSTQQLEEVEA